MEKKWHTKTTSEIFEYFNSGEKGLLQEDADGRIKKDGLNKLPESKPDSRIVIFLRQFQSPLIYILLLACAIVFWMRETVDAIVILSVLVFNAVVGSIQEGRAQNTLRSLKKYAEARAFVIRGGKEFVIKDEEVVAGDILVLREGEKIPADARVFSSNNLKLNESALSGESLPVNKIAELLEGENLQVSEQRNMVFKGTNILSGSGLAIVTATGSRTEIGKIAEKISSFEEEVPLKKNIKYLSRAIIFAVFFLNVALFIQGVATGKGIKEMFATLVSLSVSVIPEGLPIVMTLILATGVWRMGKRNVLVKKLQAVEALGQAEVIAVDKTGTVTQNEMVVKKVYTGGKMFNIGGLGYDPKGDIEHDGKVIDPLNHQELIFAVKNAALCANANIMFLEKEQKWSVSGDPTEAALLVLAQKVGFQKDILDQEAPVVSENPFDYKLKYHACERKSENGNFLIQSGAPEAVLEMCNISKNEKERLQEVFEKMSENGLRVVALSVNNSFIAFFGMKDALRKEVFEAMDRARKAGVKVIMITGDHKITALAIAKEAGIYIDGDKIITGNDLEEMDEARLEEKIENASVFARVSPEHKLRIIKAFRAKGKIVAMTGDGVNDAPSLVAADLGVAMGKIGTEVAKDASDIVLLDDNFGSIVSAIEEGRSIYKSIKKVVLYLFSTSIGEVLTIGGALFLGYPLPILPAQIIWLNFVTDGFLDVSLAMEPKEKNLLEKKFKKPNKYLIDQLMAQRMVLMSVIMMIGALFVFSGIFENNLAKAQTMSLVVLAVFQWFNAWNCRSEDKSIFAINPFSNKFLIGATAIVIALQLLAVYNPFLQKILQTVPLSVKDWGLAVLVGLSIVAVEEMRKIVYNLVKIK